MIICIPLPTNAYAYLPVPQYDIFSCQFYKKFVLFAIRVSVIIDAISTFRHTNISRADPLR